MKTDHLDLVQVHMSPTRAELEQEGTLEELEALRDEGKVRFIGMSGTLPELPDHLAMGVFDAFQIPYSALQREHEELIAEAAALGAGTVIRGGVARGAAATDDASASRASAERRERLANAISEELLDQMSPAEFLLRFTLSHPALHTTIVGTSQIAHLRANLTAAEKGPLPTDLYEEAKARFAEAG